MYYSVLRLRSVEHAHAQGRRGLLLNLHCSERESERDSNCRAKRGNIRDIGVQILSFAYTYILYICRYLCAQLLSRLGMQLNSRIRSVYVLYTHGHNTSTRQYIFAIIAERSEAIFAI